MSYEIQVRPNRRDLLTSEDAAASFQNMDVLVEPTRTCLRRFAEVAAHKPAASIKQQ